jgi:hypothetical protein
MIGSGGAMPQKKGYAQATKKPNPVRSQTFGKLIGGLVRGLIGMGSVMNTGAYFLCKIYQLFLFSYNSDKLLISLLDSVFFHTALFFYSLPHLSFFIS